MSFAIGFSSAGWGTLDIVWSSIIGLSIVFGGNKLKPTEGKKYPDLSGKTGTITLNTKEMVGRIVISQGGKRERIVRVSVWSRTRPMKLRIKTVRKVQSLLKQRWQSMRRRSNLSVIIIWWRDPKRRERWSVRLRGVWRVKPGANLRYGQTKTPVSMTARQTHRT